MNMNRSFKGIALAGLSVSFMLVGCTLNTYGLTQSEYRKVDKYYDADKMVSDLKKLHYSDEHIENQLRNALSRIEYEKGSKEEESSSKESKSNVSDTEGEKKVKVSEKDYPYRLTELHLEFQYHLKKLEKKTDELFTEKSVYIGEIDSLISHISLDINRFEKIKPPKKYEDYQFLIQEGVEEIRKHLIKVEDAVRQYDGKYDKDKAKEIIQNGMFGIDDSASKWETVFNEINEKYPDVEQKVKEENQKHAKEGHRKDDLNDKVSGSDVDKYKADIVGNTNKMDEVIRLIQDIGYSDVKDDESKKSEIQLSLDMAKTHVRDMKYLEAPKGLEVEQEKIKQAMDNYWDALQLLSEALEEQNDNKLEQANNKAEQAMKLFKKVTESIKSKTN
ncbi:DUF7018 domain-containing (lipo)protein [Bacillus thuringiensis]|uniref:DUF7018 domain-containing (lipo)protein n=2 Tax=Bacillus thuringiensis TaxID=1428 RepID=UPI000BED0F48|nr:hypothetical protein [Bacillus thuringiensis]MED3057161.1 hypothetical protein [Bacillus thuringiensis]PDX91085.1 hypothetical protein COM78_31040 [Bacillus thuringiensis]PEA11967.1 hypothetical protein CON42_29375 [Bacillus thuringiensis]PER52129.1 hypothetical protein CN486_25755 [Bacillus thuringiensis]PEV68465.1 hypothetical protein CN434_14760 [Bacillus thuringiensis]